MTANFLPALADAKDYPPAMVEMLPRERVAGSENKRELPEACVAIESMALARGLLSAIAYCFKNKKVLIPAYHCPAMVEPFLYHHCDIDYYAVNEKLGFDQDELEAKLITADVVVGVRYFGFHSNMARLKALAMKTNTFMVEDLAHAAFAPKLYGDVAVTSLQKFYPIDAGAELYIVNPQWQTKCQKAITKLRPSKLYYLYRKALVKLRCRPTQTKFRYFSPVFSHAALNSSNGYLLEHYNHQQAAKFRRANYESLASAFAELAFAEPFFPILEADVVPYVFPLLIKDEKYFGLIRQAGIPLYRWEEMVESHCPVSLRFRKLLVQLPCHQDLTSADIDFMIAAIWKIDDQYRHQN